MELTYIYPPLFKPFYPMATRIITENLLRNPALRVSFSEIPVKTYRSGTAERVYREIMAGAEKVLSPNALAFLRQKYTVNSLFYLFMTHGYYEETLETGEVAPHVMLTCINFCDLLLVKDLLLKGKKVLMGGPLVTIGLSPAFLRRLLQEMGVPGSLLEERLIIVGGNLDVDTDLHALITAWKDATLTDTRCVTAFACRRDFLQGLYGETEEEVPVHLGFNNRCWYAKCRFCTYKLLPAMDFLEEGREEAIIQSIHETMSGFRSRRIRFIDSYFHIHRPAVTRVLEGVRDYHITVYSGIKLLQDEAYLRFINRTCNCLLIGLESVSDFSLQSVRKGYGAADIERTLEKILHHLSKDVFLEISVILDLPARDREDVRVGYRRLGEIKERLEGAGFKVGLHLNILSVFPNMELLHQEGGLLRAFPDRGSGEGGSGRNYLVHLLRSSGMGGRSRLPRQTLLRDAAQAPDVHYGYLSYDIPVVRYDIAGKELPSDLEIIAEQDMERLLARRSRRHDSAPAEGGEASPGATQIPANDLDTTCPPR